MSHELIITPGGHLTLVEHSRLEDSTPPLAKAVVAAFADGPAHGLLHLATSALQASLPAGLEYARSFARAYLTRLCQTPDIQSARELAPLPAPAGADLASWILQAPPMTGLEYLTTEALTAWWTDLDTLVREEIHG